MPETAIAPVRLVIEVPPPPPVPDGYGAAGILIQKARVSHPASYDFDLEQLADAVAQWVKMGTEDADMLVTCEVLGPTGATTKYTRWNWALCVWTDWKAM